MNPTSILEYGHSPRRRRIRVLGTLVIACLLAGCVWYYQRPVRSYLYDRYADWRYSREFDRISRTLGSDADSWSVVTFSAPADQDLQSLLKFSHPMMASYRGHGPNTVVIVAGGKAGGTPWVSFACINPTGLEVYAFSKDQRMSPGYYRPYSTRQFWDDRSDNSGSLTINVEKVENKNGMIRTVVLINGGRNVIDWSLGPPVNPAPAAAPIAPLSAVSTTGTPSTGWTHSGDWWPDTVDVRHISGPGPSRNLQAVGESRAIAFTPDGRIALAAAKEFALIDPASNAVTIHPLPDTRNDYDIAAFSPGGRTCFMGGTTRSSLMIDSISGQVRPLGETAGMAVPSFASNELLMLLDNINLRRIDCASGRSELVKMPFEAVSNMAAGGGLTALTSVGSPDVRVVDAVFSPRASFEGIQGLHQISLSPDGRWLALKGQQGISLFDVKTGQRIWEHNMNRDLGTARSRIKWSADGTRGAAAGDMHVYVWSMVEPRWAAKFFHGRLGFSPDVALSPDGNRMAVAAAGMRSIAIWDDIDASLQGTK